MKVRVALWAFAGLLVATGWWLYIWATAPSPIAAQGLFWILAQLSCPLVLAGMRFHFGVSMASTFLSNTVAYALTGLLVEILHRQLSSSHPPAVLH